MSPTNAKKFIITRNGNRDSRRAWPGGAEELMGLMGGGGDGADYRVGWDVAKVAGV